MKKLIIICAALLLASPAFGTFDTSNSDWTQPFSSDANTRGLWHFDQEWGDTIFDDASSYGNDGTTDKGLGTGPWRYRDLYSTATWATSMTGFDTKVHTWRVNNTNQNVGALEVPQNYWTGSETNNSLAFSVGTDITIEFWMKPTATGSGSWQDPVLQKGTAADYCVEYMDNIIRYRCYAAGGWQSIDSVDTAPLNEWTHIAVVIDRTTLSDTDLIGFFFNGQLGSGGWQVTPWAGVHGGNENTLSLFIASNHVSDGLESFNGQLDEIRISDVCRYIPEPTTLSLLAIGALAFLRRRKK
jgi:hypothetical protein